MRGLRRDARIVPSRRRAGARRARCRPAAASGARCDVVGGAARTPVVVPHREHGARSLAHHDHLRGVGEEPGVRAADVESSGGLRASRQVGERSSALGRRLAPLHLREAVTRYPSAQILAPAALARKRPGHRRRPCGRRACALPPTDARARPHGPRVQRARRAGSPRTSSCGSSVATAGARRAAPGASSSRLSTRTLAHGSPRRSPERAPQRPIALRYGGHRDEAA